MSQERKPLEYPDMPGVVYDSEVGVEYYKPQDETPSSEKVFSYHISYGYQKRETLQVHFGAATLSRKGLNRFAEETLYGFCADLTEKLDAEPGTFVILGIIPLPLQHPDAQ